MVENEITAQQRKNILHALVEEDSRRHDEIFKEYDPLTGFNCYGFENRVRVEISDFIVPVMYMPKECMSNLLIHQVVHYGSIKKFVEIEQGMECTRQHFDYVTMLICQERCKEDPEFAMYIEDKIQDKTTGKLIPFRLNYPQRRLLKELEDQRRSGHAAYVLVLKARQWGGSTLSQLYIKWIQDHRQDGWNAVVIAQKKGTSKKIKAMYKLAIQNQPGWTLGQPGEKFSMMPFENSSDDFVVKNTKNEQVRRSTLTVAAFEIIDNVRGSNFHCAHYSEVAYWKQTQEHDPNAVISAIHASIDDLQDNVEIYETTGRGASGLFYELWQEAKDPDIPSIYKPLFVPFYILEKDMIPVNDKTRFAGWLYDNKDLDTNVPGYRETGKFFWHLWELGASFDAINWYRKTRNGYKDHTSMATEAPIDDIEAFRTSGNLVFDPYSVEDLRMDCEKPPMYKANIIISAGAKDKRTIEKSSIIFTDTGDIKIWKVPNNGLMQVKNRYLVCVDIGGSSSSSDYTVMTVIDRMGLIPGVNGKLEVVARYRGHCRHDILAWKATILAHYYDNALLVIESNTADREKNNNTEGDHFGSIIEQIADYYDNLYMRAPSSESVNEKPQRKFGFQTNRLNKGWLIDNLVAFVEDKLWIEPDHEMYKELLIYERRDDGTLGNIVANGNHDDVLMSTAIGLWVAVNDCDDVDWRKNSTKSSRKKRVMTEATI